VIKYQSKNISQYKSII